MLRPVLPMTAVSTSPSNGVVLLARMIGQAMRHTPEVVGGSKEAAPRCGGSWTAGFIGDSGCAGESFRTPWRRLAQEVSYPIYYCVASHLRACSVTQRSGHEEAHHHPY